MTLDTYLVTVLDPRGTQHRHTVVAPSAAVAYGIVATILAPVHGWTVQSATGPHIV